MSGELQTIPARHGVATFVPRGRTIKVINTYGKQVVSMWAFSLGPPPEDEEESEAQEVDDEALQKEADGLKNAIEQGGGKETAENDIAESSNKDQGGEPASQTEDTKEEGESTGKETESTEKETDKSSGDNDDPPEQAPDTPENEKSSENTSKQAGKRTWASYLPSIPYRNKGAPSKPKAEEKPSPEDEKAQTEANTKKWSSYLPTGKGFSSYVPNVQIPESKDMVNAFKTTHSRDPNKSYAEQLYDFSKTPVGAGTIAAATGSGYASSVYAAYSAYASTHPSSANLPPMEYLSLPHTRASTHKLVPEADDELLTNLRNPIITLVEDTSPGAHDTLTAACDANLYRSLGVDKPEEHPSCAVNLVLALKELNESAGLKGAKAIGADITVNIAPTPLHLFMNAPVQISDNNADGAGAKGITLAVEEPKGKKRSHVRFRAERDVVIVFSSCPMDVGNQNGGRCMAANFMVEDVQEGEDLAASISSLKQGQKKAPKKLSGKPSPKRVDEKIDSGEKPEQKKDVKAEEVKRPEPVKRKSLPRKLSGTGQADAGKKAEGKKSDAIPEETGDASTPTKDDKTSAGTSSEEQKPKKKPKKLQVRGGGASTPAKSS